MEVSKEVKENIKTKNLKEIKDLKEKPGIDKSSYSMSRTFLYAFGQSSPIIFSYIVVGFAFGIMMQEAGYTPLHVLLSGIFIYSGSLQIAMVPLMVAGTSLPVMAFAAFIINSRYMFYGIGYTERFKRQGILYPYMIFAFPDEVYCVFSSTAYPTGVDPDKCDLLTALMCHLSWISGGLLGVFLGDVVSFDMSGIDFAATCLFVCICVNQWREYKSHIPVYIGVIAAAVCIIIFGTENFMLPALSLSLVLLVIMRKRTEEAMTETEPETGFDKVKDSFMEERNE